MPKFYYVKSSNCPKSLRLSFLLLLFPIFSFGQTLTGLWTGALHNDSSTIRKDHLFEIALTEYNGKVYGYSRSEFIVNDTLYYIVKRVKGTIEGDVCEVSDDEVISYNFRGRLDKGIKVTSTFRRNQTDSAWYLDGTWKTNATKKYYSVTGKVTLSEEKDLAMSKLFPHLEELNLANDVAFYKERIPAPAVVRVAKPTTIYQTKPELSSKPTETLTISAKPVPAAAVTITPAEETVAAPVKRTSDDPVKTGTKNIPAANDFAMNQKPQTSAPDMNSNVAVTKKKQPATTGASDYEPTGVTNEPAGNTNKQTTLVDRRNNATDKQPTSNAAPLAISKQQNNKPVVPAINTSFADKKIAASSPPKQTDAVATTPVNKPAASPAEQVTGKTTVDNPSVKAQPAAIIASTSKTDQPEAVKQPVPDITVKAAVISGRKSEFSQVVNFKSDSLVISLYDNGEIDGDTVSVFMNGEPLISKQGLKSSAIKKTIYIPSGQEQDFTLVMFAESLGKYPPNTGLLVIRDGDDVYNLRFSSDFEKNAGIVFRRKK